MPIDDLEYREYEPPPSLGTFVRCLWTLEGPAAAEREAQPVVPDGCMELIVNVADPFHRDRGDGVVVEQPLEMLVGQLTGPAVIVPSGAVNLIGVRLHPWGAAAFLGLPVSELAGEMYSLGEVSRELASLSDEISEPTSATSRVTTLSAALERRWRRRQAPDPALRAAVQLVARPPLPREPGVRELAARLGRSVRWVQRAFADTVGLSPKTLARIARVQRALRIARASGTKSWAAIAADAGYFDHSHLVRDFRQFVGCTPSQLHSRAGSLTDAFIES